MNNAAWRTAQSTAVTALMPQAEVQRNNELYSFFERIDHAHEEEADAIAAAFSYIAHAKHLEKRSGQPTWRESMICCHRCQRSTFVMAS
jgi:hypothetical protein